jgi:hypothetical protein
VRFALAGAALFAVLDRWTPEPPPPVTNAAVAGAAEDALLLDVALAGGLDRSDPLVRARLSNLGRYLELEPDAAGDAALEQQARGLDLVHSDPIIRRHLIDLMHLTAASLPPALLPSEDELRTYYGQHVTEYTLPPRTRLRHVYLSRDRRGPRLAADADALLERLHGQGSESGVGVGDGFARGAEVGPASDAELLRTFGPAFTAALAALPTRQWSGPIASAYGLHLVWIEERRAAAAPPFADVRGQLLHAWLRERRAEQLAASLSALRGS